MPRSGRRRVMHAPSAHLQLVMRTCALSLAHGKATPAGAYAVMTFDKAFGHICTDVNGYHGTKAAYISSFLKSRTSPLPLSVDRRVKFHASTRWPTPIAQMPRRQMSGNIIAGVVDYADSFLRHAAHWTKKVFHPL